MSIRACLSACLVFSGLSALVYQVLWTRLLGFAFGTTSEAIGTVLAVFFGGMAIGNLLAARWQASVERPLRLYGLLELGIGLFALISLPLLRRLDSLYAVVGTEHSPSSMLAIRTAVAALLLLPPTIAMGATLPVVARGLVAQDHSLGRWSAYLYSANTFGAVLGAYLCGFWMIPHLGLTRTVVVAAIVNLAVAASVWFWAGHVRVDASDLRAARAAENPTAAVADHAGRSWFLVFFGISGFVAIGYEIVWSKVFTIVMEGTLYGFSTVLSAYLLGLALGSIAIAQRVDGIRDLPRAFGLLHAGIALSVALGLLVVADLPHWHHRIAGLLAGGAGIHGLYLLAAPIVLLPSMLFGAAFPILIRLYTSRANRVGEGMGIATAINTGGSIAASLLIGFWAIPEIGIDATLYALVLLELLVALAVLLRFQTSQGRQRVLASAATGLLLVGFSLSYNGVQLEKAVAGRWIEAPSLAAYREQLDQHLALNRLVVEGRTSVVTVNSQPGGLKLMTNGMPEAGFNYAPPHRALASLLLGIAPYLAVESPQRALVIGFGGGATLDALLLTQLERIEVVELEKRVLEAASLLYQGRPNPLADPRVELHINDGRNHLLLARYRGEGGYDVIASQPSHPWLAGAANLFTEEYFELARDNLNPGGAFALWVNGFHARSDSLLALFTSFERIFPGAVLLSAGTDDHRSSLILVGARAPHRWLLDRLDQRLAEPKIRDALHGHDVDDTNALLARFEGPLAAFAAISPQSSNTDDNAYVEMSLSRGLGWGTHEWTEIEARLADDAPTLPSFERELDVPALVGAMLAAQGHARSGSYGPKAQRLLRAHGAGIEPALRDVLSAEIELRRRDAEETTRSAAIEQLEALARLPAAAHSGRADIEALRALAHWRAEKERDFARAGELFAEAYRRSGAAEDAFDAARAFGWVDFDEAWHYVNEIPPLERERFPRIALFEADHLLAQLRKGAKPARATVLTHHYDRLKVYLDTDEGRLFPGVHATLARLAEALGNERLARAHADSDMHQRGSRAVSHLMEVRNALAAGRLDEADAALAQARALIPIDVAVLRAEAEIAAARDDAPRLSEALWQLRSWAPSMQDGVGSENILRASLKLPMLPDRAPELLGRSDSSVGRQR